MCIRVRSVRRNVCLGDALSLIGLSTFTVCPSVLLWAAEPILILVLAALGLGDRIGPGILSLSLSAVAGLLLVLFDPAATGSPVGVGLALSGVAACAAYPVCTRRWLVAADSTCGVVCAQ